METFMTFSNSILCPELLQLGNPCSALANTANREIGVRDIIGNQQSILSKY